MRNKRVNFDLSTLAKKMATEGIVTDIGAIYKRLFNHRPNIQNEVHYFVREFETKRGDSDLTTLQDCMRLANEMDVVFLEDIMTSTPHFRSIREKVEEIGELGNDILAAERTNLTIPPDEQSTLDRRVDEYRQQLQQEQELLDAQYAERVEALKQEIRACRDARGRLRAASLSGSSNVSVSRGSSVEQTSQYSIQNLSYTDDEDDDDDNDGSDGDGDS